MLISVTGADVLDEEGNEASEVDGTAAGRGGMGGGKRSSGEESTLITSRCKDNDNKLVLVLLIPLLFPVYFI